MITTLNIAWAAGFLEGEGGFQSRGPSAYVTAAQVQREPLERLHAMFGGRISEHASTNPKHSAHFRWVLHNVAARGLMMTLFGLMSPRRRLQIVKALAVWRARGMAQPMRTHCPRGHAYDAANAGLNKTTGGRRCRACARTYINAHNARKRITET